MVEAASAESRRRAQREYYRRNKKKINAQRRRNYREDPKLREEHRARCREQYQARKERANTGRTFSQRRRPRRAKLKMGKHAPSIYVVPIGYFARRLGVAPKTVRKWEEIGVIPEMGLREKTARYWPVLFIEITREVIRDLVPEGVARGVKLLGRGIKEKVIKRWNAEKKLYLQEPDYGRALIEINPEGGSNGQAQEKGVRKKVTRKRKSKARRKKVSRKKVSRKK